LSLRRYVNANWKFIHCSNQRQPYKECILTYSIRTYIYFICTILQQQLSVAISRSRNRSRRRSIANWVAVAIKQLDIIFILFYYIFYILKHFILWRR